MIVFDASMPAAIPALLFETPHLHKAARESDPFRRHYFPDERHPNEVLQATLFLVAAAIFVLEGCFLLLSRRLRPAK